jgi:hypothetical protein
MANKNRRMTGSRKSRASPRLCGGLKLSLKPLWKDYALKLTYSIFRAVCRRPF